ncbi:MAG: Cell division protein FtsB [Chlorobi bacterium OLB5]|nr:MAG: Cell division protein FtsB [Chlorobi bacterium OLB5]
MKEDSFGKNIVRYIYHRRKFFVYLLILLAVLSYAVFGKKGILQRVELEMENRELRDKLKAEQERTIILQKEIEDLKTSDKKIEKVAREKYNMVKDGEEIYKVVTDSTK